MTEHGDRITPEQMKEAGEAFRRLAKAARKAAVSLREFVQNATDADLENALADNEDWEGPARRKTDDNLRGVFG